MCAMCYRNLRPGSEYCISRMHIAVSMDTYATERVDLPSLLDVLLRTSCAHTDGAV